jgi:hypothetical protein
MREKKLRKKIRQTSLSPRGKQKMTFWDTPTLRSFSGGAPTL